MSLTPSPPPSHPDSLLLSITTAFHSQDPDKGEEGAVKSKRNARKEEAAAKAKAKGKKEEGPALALPPAAEKNFIGFLPEEFCAPFRLLFQLFAVAGWP